MASTTRSRIHRRDKLEEFHAIADAHGVRLELRANGFVFHSSAFADPRQCEFDRSPIGKDGAGSSPRHFYSG